MPSAYSGIVGRTWLVLIGLLWTAGCGGGVARQYPVHGQIVAIGGGIGDGRHNVTLKHGDIPGFMPAMTMAYAVREPGDLDGLAAGDTIAATLVLAGNDVYLTRITKTGHAPVPPDAHPIRIMDVMNPGDPVPEEPLTDQAGAVHRLSDWRGQALAVTFVYTRCPLPDFCPLMDQHFAELQRLIDGDQALRHHVHLVSISFDPTHDTPAVIAAHASAHGADGQTWSYLTGTTAAIDALTSRFGVSTIKGDDGGTLITHNLRTAVVDPRGRLVTVHSGNDWTVAELLAELRAADAR